MRRQRRWMQACQRHTTYIYLIYFDEPSSRKLFLGEQSRLGRSFRGNAPCVLVWNAHMRVCVRVCTFYYRVVYATWIAFDVIPVDIYLYIMTVI